MMYETETPELYEQAAVIIRNAEEQNESPYKAIQIVMKVGYGRAMEIVQKVKEETQGE